MPTVELHCTAHQRGTSDWCWTERHRIAAPTGPRILWRLTQTGKRNREGHGGQHGIGSNEQAPEHSLTHSAEQKNQIGSFEKIHTRFTLEDSPRIVPFSHHLMNGPKQEPSTESKNPETASRQYPKPPHTILRNEFNWNVGTAAAAANENRTRIMRNLRLTNGPARLGSSLSLTNTLCSHCLHHKLDTQ